MLVHHHVRHRAVARLGFEDVGGRNVVGKEDGALLRALAFHVHGQLVLVAGHRHAHFAIPLDERACVSVCNALGEFCGRYGASGIGGLRIGLAAVGLKPESPGGLGAEGAYQTEDVALAYALTSGHQIQRRAFGQQVLDETPDGARVVAPFGSGQRQAGRQVERPSMLQPCRRIPQSPKIVVRVMGHIGHVRADIVPQRKRKRRRRGHVRFRPVEAVPSGRPAWAR